MWNCFFSSSMTISSANNSWLHWHIRPIKSEKEKKISSKHQIKMTFGMLLLWNDACCLGICHDCMFIDWKFAICLKHKPPETYMTHKCRKASSMCNDVPHLLKCSSSRFFFFLISIQSYKNSLILLILDQFELI